MRIVFTILAHGLSEAALCFFLYLSVPSLSRDSGAMFSHGLALSSLVLAFCIGVVLFKVRRVVDGMCEGKQCVH